MPIPRTPGQWFIAFVALLIGALIGILVFVFSGKVVTWLKNRQATKNEDLRVVAPPQMAAAYQQAQAQPKTAQPTTTLPPGVDRAMTIG